MAQLVFSSVSGGTTTLNGTNTAGTYNLTVPAADGTLLYQDTSGNITFDNVTITGSLSITGTSAFKIPSGTTIQRPGVPVAGDIRYNTDGGGLYEGYLPAVSAWYKFSMVPEGQYTISYVIVAGGGGGGSNSGGGGGAGGAIINSFTALPSTAFTVVVGAGGTAGANGSNSYITGVATATGGGAGGTNGPSNGATGGSGGGGSGTQSGQTSSGGGGIPSEGFSGGGSNNATGAGGGGGYTAGGAGGGYGAVEGGVGGAGATITITGTTLYVAGGGGGAAAYYSGGSGGAGGVGGGGNGAPTGSGGANATINTGGGGGGGGAGVGISGGNGGSGVVYMSMPTANYTGTVTGLPTVTTSGSNTILKFTNSGSYTA